MLRRLPWLLIALAVACIAAGCGQPQQLRPPLLAGAETATLEQARAALVEAQVRVQALEAAQEARRQEYQRRLLGWASALALLGSLLCAGLAFALPPLRRSLGLAALGCLGVLLAAQALGHLLPWLPLAGGALALCVLGFLLWRVLRALRDSTKLAEELKQNAPPLLLDAARALQAQRGTRHLINRVRASV
jgi:hypothetical protein